ncbi:hypothetical protein BYT27DRAFT_7192388 [Phlegmacium glaucopus]|nr:hypothetical protein BYT27DRAFT_7192388 [Phlegmacium glaucopus]
MRSFPSGWFLMSMLHPSEPIYDKLRISKQFKANMIYPATISGRVPMICTAVWFWYTRL